ncbi:Rad51 domain-containing protein, partial [Cephalotus follicularis]
FRFLPLYRYYKSPIRVNLDINAIHTNCHLTSRIKLKPHSKLKSCRACSVREMAPLKSLEREYPLIDSNFQNFCASHAIFTVQDFLLHDLYVLAAYAEQLSNSKRLKQGITQLLSIIDHQHQPWLNGMELLEDAQRNKHALPTGNEGFDLFLQGGLREGQLTELVGPSSSGKTQICLQAASNVAKMRIGYVLYLDTGNSFSSLRIAQLAGLNSGPAFSQAKHEVLQKVMSSIFCHSVYDIFMMLDLLHQLDFNLRSKIDKGECQVRLLIIDSISSVIAPILGGSSSQGHALMVSAGFLLKKLAHEHNLAVLVTNHTVGGEGGISKPALGESWKSIPHVRLLLSRDHRSNACNVSILKHPSMVSATAARLLIYD